MTIPHFWCSTFVALLLSLEASSQTPDALSIERLVARRLADDRPIGRVAVDVRQRISGKWGAMSDSAFGRRLADSISASYRSLPLAIACDRSRRSMPGAGCRLSDDLDAFIVVSVPDINGDSAVVTVSVARHQRSQQDLLGHIFYRDETLVFVRRNGTWVFDRVRERRVT